MTDKETIINLLPGQIIDVRSATRKMRVSFPEGKTKNDTTRTLMRDLGTWVPAPVEPPPVEPPPVEPPPTIPPPATTVTVRSYAELYTALTANEPDITIAPGTYSGTLDINARFAARTRPGVIHCDGVVINGGGLNHRGGAHDLDWVGGITFANWTLTQTGVLCFGGYDEPAAHHITIRKPKILSSVRRSALSQSTEHGVYFSHSRGGCHDILIEDLDVDASAAMGLSTAVHAYHADGGLLNAYNVVIRRLKYVGNRGLGEPTVQQALILWVPQHDWLIDGATITNANGRAVRFESSPASNIVFKDVTSTNSGGFYSSMGANPPGVTFVNCNLG